MSNLYNALSNTNAFKKYKIDDLLFAEYKCFDEGIKTEIWTHNNFFSFIIRGKMLWSTNDTEVIVKKGDAFFVKKGAMKVQTFYKEDFCELIIFVPDEFIKEVVNKHKISFASVKTKHKNKSIFSLHSENILTAYFESLYSYFTQSKQPSESLLKLKFEELIINIISNDRNQYVINHFKNICECSRISLREIMEANFTSNLTLDEFANLCARSLSTFKRDFFRIYKKTPGKWLTEKRLEFSKYLIKNTNKNIEEIIFESGFRNRSHFIKIFKEKYGTTPLKFRTSKHSLRKVI